MRNITIFLHSFMGSPEQMPAASLPSFSEFITHLHAELKDKSLATKILERMSDPNTTVSMAELAEMTKAALAIQDRNDTPPDVFCALAHHAISLIRIEAINLLLEDRNRAGFMPSRDEDPIRWVQDPTYVEEVIS